MHIRYPHDAEVLGMPTGARLAGERNQRALLRAEKAGEAFGLLARITRADKAGDYNLCTALIEEARGLLAAVGGAA